MVRQKQKNDTTEWISVVYYIYGEKQKVMCFYFSTGTRISDRCGHSAGSDRQLMQRGPREQDNVRRVIYNSLCNVRLFNFFLHLLDHAVLCLVSGPPPKILSRRDAITNTKNQRIIFESLDEYILGLRRGKWCEELRRKNFYQHYGKAHCLLRQALKKNDKKLHKHRICRRTGHNQKDGSPFN